ncbi:MAG: ABC transporter substrate-binding protein [Actinomycetota bacterium]
MTVGLRLAVGVLSALAIVGCSGDDDAGDGDEPSDAPVVAEAATGGGRAVADVGSRDGSSEDDEEAPEVDDIDSVTPPDGTVVWVTGAEPADLHLDDPANGLTVTAWIREGLLESLFGVGPDLTYHPELLAAEPTITDLDNAAVAIDYRLRSDLSWSDGTPLTAEDVAYTHRILIEGCQADPDGSIVDGSPDGCVYLTGNRLGIDQVTDFEVLSDTDFRVTMAGFYPDWRRLWSPVLAAHAFGDDADTVNRRLRNMIGPGGPLPSSGPLRLERWNRGGSMLLVANEAYHGANGPGAGSAADVDGGMPVEAVRIDFEADPDARIAALVDGRADLLIERSRDGHLALVDDEAIEVAAVDGPDYDHVGLNLLNPHLARPEVRQALITAIDKEALIEAVYRPLVGRDGRVSSQGNTYWLAGQPAYADHQTDYLGADPDGARALLERAGYVVDDDGGYRHPVDGPLRLRLATIGGDPIREASQAVLIEQLGEAGIEVVADNPSGGRFFREGPFDPESLAASASGGDDGDADLWDLALFAWAGGPWPGAQSGVYRNGSPGNPYGFSDAEFEVLAFECDAVVDDGGRADCYNELDRFVTTLRGGGGSSDEPADGAGESEDPTDPADDTGSDDDTEVAATDETATDGSSGLFMIPLVQRPFLLAYRSDRLLEPPAPSASIRGGPLALARDYLLADG